MLSRIYDGLDASEMLQEALLGDLGGRVALVSSFGAESVALLKLVADIDRGTPVIFLDTEMLFEETLAYQVGVAAALRLGDVRIIHPDPREVAENDPVGDLHQSDKDACCALRKTAPLSRALSGFDGWITGRKRYQGGARASLPRFGTDADGRLKLNPIADWDAAQVSAFIDDHALPRHPLFAQGYPSIGCAPCTSKVAPGEDARAGRWRGEDKSECGIHFDNGRLVRGVAPAA
ncbi:MAG: phosphoadenylyl-sulfate reductase [Pseudomonadota bacterium]